MILGANCPTETMIYYPFLTIFKMTVLYIFDLWGKEILLRIFPVTLRKSKHAQCAIVCHYLHISVNFFFKYYAILVASTLHSKHIITQFLN